MTEPVRDGKIQTALGTVRAPEHRPGFWDDLEAAMDDEAGVVTLPRRSTARWLSAAAAIVAIAVGAVALSRGGEGSRRVEFSDQPSPTTEATVPVGAATPDGAVREWIHALGVGDIDRAVALTGPRTERYMTSLGGTLRGYLTEAQEGYGAWDASPDLNTTEIELPISREAITIVVLTGTWTGEGGTETRADALPVVNTGSGWRVEPSAFRSDTGGRLEVEITGSDVTATAPGEGGFFFSENDGPVLGAGSERGQAKFAMSEARNQTHLVVVAYVDGDTITAVAKRVRR